ncbi:MAG: diacylglycerol kinase family protein [Akkermansiaceae bacterium]|nr:diacylglycerol kinase family protein [Akkermansiaceae bacterium]
MGKPFSVAARLRSFGYASAGLWRVLRHEHNAWVHAVATVAVVVAGFVLKVSAADWRWLVVAMVAVWVAECFNTALECLANAVSPDTHPLIKAAKDIAAGAVLITAIGAAVIGVLVFWPYLCD